MSGYQATVLKRSSNTTIPQAWITDPATESWLMYNVQFLCRPFCPGICPSLIGEQDRDQACVCNDDVDHSRSTAVPGYSL